MNQKDKEVVYLTPAGLIKLKMRIEQLKNEIQGIEYLIREVSVVRLPEDKS